MNAPSPESSYWCGLWEEPVYYHEQLNSPARFAPLVGLELKNGTLRSPITLPPIHHGTDGRACEALPRASRYSRGDGRDRGLCNACFRILSILLNLRSQAAGHDQAVVARGGICGDGGSHAIDEAQGGADDQGVCSHPGFQLTRNSHRRPHRRSTPPRHSTSAEHGGGDLYAGHF
jgi:hypothetical protein